MLKIPFASYISPFLILCIYFSNVSGSGNLHVPDKINFKHLGVEDGLIDYTVTCIAKDDKGFIWIGTANGLCRYDGYDFEYYFNIPEDSTSISGNFISSILLDSQNRLWISTLRNGINLYNRELNNFKQILGAKHTGQNLIRKIVEHDHQNLLLASYGAGLLKYNLKSDKIELLSANFESNIYSDYIADVEKDEDNNYWLSHIDGGITWVNATFTDAEKYQYNAGVYDNLFHPFRGDILVQEQEIWICNAPDGLLRFDRNKHSFSRVPIRRNGKGLYGNDVVKVIPYSPNHLLVAIDHGGLNILNTETYETKYFLENPANSGSLKNNQLLCIYRDNTDLFWIGHFKGGISIFDPDHAVFTNYTRDETRSSLSDNSVTYIHEDNEGRIWMGTDGGGLNMLDKTTGEIEIFRHDPEFETSLGSDLISCIYDDSEGTLWVGTYYGGLNAFYPESNTAIRFGPDSKGYRHFESSVVTQIMEDNKGRLWISTLNRGLFIQYKRGEPFVNLNFLGKYELISEAVVTTKQDVSGKIWIGYDDIGVLVYKEADGSVEWYKNIPGDSSSLASNTVNFIYSDSKNQIWVGTPEALHLYNKADKTFTRFTEGYFGVKTIKSLVEDTEGNYWIGSLSGLAIFNPSEKKVRIYDNLNGLQGNEFNKGAAIRDAEGKLFFGGTQGLSVFDPLLIKDGVEIPPVQITGFFLRYQPIDSRGPNSPLNRSISEIQTIKLSHKQNYIGFKFAALNYLNADKNTYACYLEPLEEDFHYLGNQRIAHYANLKPGTYTFHVKGSNQGAVWNEEGQSIEVIITPPLWSRLWFQLLIIIAAAAVILLIYYLRIKAIEAQKRKLEKLVREQTEQLKLQNSRLVEHMNMLNESNAKLEERQQKIQEQANKLESANEELQELNKTKNKFFSIIAHDLKNPFNTVLGFAELLKLKKKSIDKNKKDQYIDAIYDSLLKIFNLLENLLEWSRAQNNRIITDPQRFLINSLINEVVELQQEAAHAKNILIKQLMADELYVFADKEMISTVIRNLVSNAVKFTPRDGKIMIEAVSTEDEVIVSVIDNGIGLSKTDQQNLFTLDKKVSREGTEGEEGTGLGLMLCKEFIEKNNGTIWADSKENEGTTFSFTLPKYRSESDQKPGTGTYASGGIKPL